MSLADDAKLLLIPTGYKTSKVYSVFPTDGDGDFDYTRSGDASRVNPGGLIETVGTNIPRIDHLGGGCPTLLLEPQRTNISKYSEDFSNSVWLKTSTTVTTNQIIAPDGTLTADKLDFSSSTSARTAQIATASSGNYVLSIYLRSVSGSGNFRIALGKFGGSLSTKTIALTEEWQRYQIEFNHDSTTDLLYYIGYYIDNSFLQEVYSWGAQLEQGSYPTSYIKTEASTVTRLKDECLNGGDSDLFDITEGTFFVDITPFNNETSNRYISLSDSSSDNRIEFQVRASANVIDVLCEGNNGGLEVIRTINITFNTRNKLLVTFDNNNFKIYINGSLNFTDTSFTKPINLNRLSFANSTNGFVFEGKVHDTRVYDRVLTETEAIELTTL